MFLGSARGFVIKTQTGRVRHDPFAREGAASPLRFLFLFFFDLDNFTAFVETAVGTHGVRQAHGTAVRAGGQVASFQRIMSTAHVAATLGMFAFWMWGH